MASTSGKGDKSELDDTLDPMSSNFNPLAALYSDQAKVPCESAPILDNITKFKEESSGTVAIVPPKQRKPVAVKATPVSTFKTDGWDNVISRMKTVEGPLSVLRECRENRQQVKVVTRNAEGVRGSLTGYIVAFDKMWNLAMEDVTETWIRKKSRKTPPAVGVNTVPKNRDRWMRVPLIEVKPFNKKAELCTRFMDKMLMRGEHVVLISIVNYSPP